MTTVIKIGKTSLDSIGKMQRIIDQVKVFDDDLVLVLSAQGNTKRRLKKAIEDFQDGRKIEPKAVFKEFEAAYNAFGSRKNQLLSVKRAAIYLRLYAGSGVKTTLPDWYVADMKLFGETLSAALFSHIMTESGMEPHYIDINREDFPLAVRGDYLHASINFEESRRRASELRKKYPHKILIIPGGGGIDIRKKNEKIKELGYGGTDTAACAYLYAFSANGLYIATNSYGMLDVHPDGRTIDELDLHEASDAMTFGAKLPGSRSLEGVRRYMDEDRKSPDIRIVNSQDMKGRHTKILKEAGKRPVKLVAGRDIMLYEIYGSNLKGLHNAMEENGIEHTSLFRPGYARIIVPTTSAHYADVLLNRVFFENNGRAREVRIAKSDKYALIGAVGNGMADQASISMRGTSALGNNGINIRYNEDPGPVSIGYVVHRRDRDDGIRALYGKFFRRK